ncbi:MAG: HNH endonuclease [Lachnospiraceae bacterium]|nr:HNH endonuclease [Lachnospiraceae bacterium]
MFKACPKCGRLHPYNFVCETKRTYNGGDERKLRSKSRWTRKSLEVREKANFLCEVCKDNNKYVYDDLEVHHIVKVKEDETKLLDNYNLICLCQECHKKAEKNLIERAYLEALAKAREEK